MRIEVKEDEKNLSVEMYNEDYSLAEIIHHELLEEKNVTFAGVVPPHPLVSKQVIKVRTQRVKPAKILQTSIDRAAEKIKTLRELLLNEQGDKK
jgi:DNA-directed RNA polymerase subunit L